MRALLSLVIAVVASALGHGLLWAGGTGIIESIQQYDGPAGAVPPLAPILAVLGALVIGAAMLTAAWSSLGVIVLGLVHIVAGTGMLLLPPMAVLSALHPVEDVDRDIAYGAEYSWATGLFVLTGVVYFVAGVAVAARRGRTSGGARAVSTVLAIVLGLGAVPVMAIAGDRLVQAVLVRFSAVVDLLGIGLLLGAAIVLAIVTATARWSSLGVIVLGVLLAAGGAAAVVASEQTDRVLFATGGAPLANGGSYVASSGGVLMLGMLLIAAGVAGLIRAARRRRLEAAPEDEELIGYQPEQPTDQLTALFPPADRV
jgi:hypothetical protein